MTFMIRLAILQVRLLLSTLYVEEPMRSRYTRFLWSLLLGPSMSELSMPAWMARRLLSRCRNATKSRRPTRRFSVTSPAFFSVTRWWRVLRNGCS
ncbi:hypothetical protein BJX62DRAFT_215746 [Aspergillus germanicus]